MHRQSLTVALLSLCIGRFAPAVNKPSSASEQTQCKFQDHTEVTVEYRSMRMNGRQIFGDLVPYGKVWEIGSERSPTFVTSANLVIGGKEIPSGRYSLSAIPNPEKWTLVVSKVPGNHGQNQIDEVASIDLTVRRLPSLVESLAISFDQLNGGCLLNLRWEATEASVLLAEKN